MFKKAFKESPTPCKEAESLKKLGQGTYYIVSRYAGRSKKAEKVGRYFWMFQKRSNVIYECSQIPNV